MQLDGAHVLVTGASRGIGRGLARALAAEGARITAVARSTGAIEELAAEVGGRALAADLSDRDTLRTLLARVEEVGGPVDVLVNNAGIDATGALADSDPGELERLVELNLLVPMELTRQALPGMIERGRGHVLNVSSLAGVAALPGMVAYATTKAALTHFTSGLRADLRGLPIGTTVVEVGLVPTDMRDAVLEHPPTAAAFRRLYRLGILTDTSLDRLCAQAVQAVAGDRRHVRLPRRAWGLSALAEAPRRMTELTLTGVRAR